MPAISLLKHSHLLASAALLLIPLTVTAQTGTPSFSKDVAPILYSNCVSCHRVGEIGPMPLTSYREAKPFVDLIAHHTSNRIMPASDVTLRNPNTFSVEPTARSFYQDAMITTGFTEDTFIQSSEVRPGLPGYTHHANVYAQVGEEEERVAGYTPGGASRQYPAGVAKLIPAGTELRLNMHYNPKGMQHTDPGAEFAFKYADGPIRQIAYTAQSSNGDIDIPPETATYELAGKTFVFAQDSHIISFMPRMNERGTDITYTLIYPDNREQVLLKVPQFQYNWVFTYELQTAIAAPAGSRLVTVAHWDNSAANPHNPDHKAHVGFGPEIMNGYFEYTLDAQDLSAGSRAVSSAN